MGYVKVIVAGEEKCLTDDFITICQQQVEEVEKSIKEHHKKANSVQDWFELCREANVTETEMRAQFSISGRHSLASPAGWAWLTQVYLPAQESAPYPRSRVWQIEERMHRDWEIAMKSGKRAERGCPFDFQLCHSESCLPDDIPPDCPAIRK